VTDKGPEIIGAEVIRLDAEIAKADHPHGTPIGRTRRKEINDRRRALVWALHVLLTGDRTNPPGAEVEAFLGALKAREGGTQ
jgi:hypothetical protein